MASRQVGQAGRRSLNTPHVLFGVWCSCIGVRVAFLSSWLSVLRVCGQGGHAAQGLRAADRVIPEVAPRLGVRNRTRTHRALYSILAVRGLGCPVQRVTENTPLLAFVLPGPVKRFVAVRGPSTCRRELEALRHGPSAGLGSDSDTALSLTKTPASVLRREGLRVHSFAATQCARCRYVVKVSHSTNKLDQGRAHGSPCRKAPPRQGIGGEAFPVLVRFGSASKPQREPSEHRTVCHELLASAVFGERARRRGVGAPRERLRRS
jgi:hypothetical protein